MDLLKEVAYHIELHSVQGLQNCFDQGLDPNGCYQGQPLFELLIGMYTRSSRFSDCVKVFIDNGLNFNNNALLWVLSENGPALETELDTNPALISQKVSLPCAYTPLREVSLLHVCAEFNLPVSAAILIRAGIDIDSVAGFDEYGFGGQTSVFHTVNQNQNNSMVMLELLLDHKTDLTHTVQGIIWGRSFPWETLIPAVNPVSYAMFGLLPQMHRNEKTISEVVCKLLWHAYGIQFTPENIPNKYLQDS